MKNKKNNVCPAKKTSIGGQALIEGIMMRGPKMTAMAIRNPEGEIVLEKWQNDVSQRPKAFKFPILRGVYGFIDSMKIGFRCLMRSAEIAGLEEETSKKDTKKEKKKKNITETSESVVAEDNIAANPTEVADTPPAAEPAPLYEEKVIESESESVPENGETADKAVPTVVYGKNEKTEENENSDKTDKTKKDSNPLMMVIMIIATVLGVGLAIFLFIMLPTFLFKQLLRIAPFLGSHSLPVNSLIKSAFEGLLKLVILVAYMGLVSRMKEIKRTFQYHGAEHKTIFCYENGKDLTVENVKSEQRFHPRCGTSFIVLMLLVGIFVSFFIDPLFFLITGSVPPVLVRTLIRFITLPVIMGIGYELLKFAGKHDNAFTRIISAPGLWLQRITVLEPTEDMIECSLAAFVEVIPNDNSDIKN